MPSLKELYIYLNNDTNDEIIKLNNFFKEINSLYEECDYFFYSSVRDNKPFVTTNSINSVILKAVKLNLLLGEISADTLMYFKGSVLEDVLSDILNSVSINDVELLYSFNETYANLYNYLIEYHKTDETDLLELFKIQYLISKGNLSKVLEIYRNTK